MPAAMDVARVRHETPGSADLAHFNDCVAV